MNACSFGFHRWTKWEMGRVTMTTIHVRDAAPEMLGKAIETVRDAQHRTCERCGRLQRRVIG